MSNMILQDLIMKLLGHLSDFHLLRPSLNSDGSIQTANISFLSIDLVFKATFQYFYLLFCDDIYCRNFLVVSSACKWWFYIFCFVFQCFFLCIFIKFRTAFLRMSSTHFLQNMRWQQQVQLIQHLHFFFILIFYIHLHFFFQYIFQ